jgi:hypothetical protein
MKWNLGDTFVGRYGGEWFWTVVAVFECAGDAWVWAENNLGETRQFFYDQMEPRLQQ